MKALVLSLVAAVFLGSSAFAIEINSLGSLNHPPYPPAPYPPRPAPPAGPNSPIQVYTVPASTKSCFARADYQNTADDIAAKHFEISNFTIYWGESNADLYVNYIRIEIRHPHLIGGSMTKVISGAELSAMGGYRGSWNGWIPRAYPGGQSFFRANCGPIMGGISFVPNGDMNMNIQGSIMLYGMRRDYRGYESSVAFGAPISVINQGTP